jgi:hypothetical protein
VSEPVQPRARGSRNLIVPVVISAVVVACGVAAVMGSLVGVGAPPTSRSSAAVGNTGSGRCTPSGVETASSLVTAPDASWRLVGLMAGPTDTSGAGPHVIASDGLRRCYARTVTGALFAVANYVVLDSVPRLAARIPAELLAPGPGREAQLADAADPGSLGYRFQIAGFAVAAYSTARATIDLAVTSSDGTLHGLPIEVTWSGGDWKIVTRSNGALPFPAVTLGSLAGYVPWSGA